jgi:iron complex outermembrane receptor protein
MKFKRRPSIISVLAVASLPLSAAIAQDPSASGGDLDSILTPAPTPGAAAQATAPTQSPPTAAPTSPRDNNSTPIEAGPGPAATAGNPVDEKPKKSTNRFVEEIVVTAQKREESLQSVPISVAAFSGDALDARGVVEPKDLQLITPGLTLGETAGFAITYIRGLGSDAFLLADPSVALYIDGIYFPFAHGIGQAMGAVQRVEVEKGPQGTLFGRNAVGGAINIVTKDPSDEPESSIQASYGRFNTINTRVYTNVPLASNLSFSVSALYNTDNNYYNGTADGQSLAKEIDEGARLKVRWKPFDNTDIVASGYVVHEQGSRSLFQPNDHPLPLFAALIKPQVGYTASLNSPVFYIQDSHVLYGQLHSNFDWFDLKLLGSTQSANTPSSFDFDGSPLPLASFVTKSLSIDAQSAELQLISNDTSWGAGWLKWIAGGYFYYGTQGFGDEELNVAGTDLGSGTLLGIQLPKPLLNLVEPLLNNLPFPVPSGTIRLNGALGTRSYAGYFQTTVNMTDWAGLTLGGRYQVEKKFLSRSQAGLEDTNGSATILFDYPYQEATLYKFSPKVSLDTHPFGDDTLVYLSGQTATKAGTYNVINIYEPPQLVKPETVKAYEVGIKTRLFDDTVQFNAAAFDYTDKNLQVQVVSLLNGGAVSFENAQGASIRGAEFDTVVQLLPSLLDGLVFTASGSWLDPKYTSYNNGSGFDPVTGLFQHQAFDFTGNQIVRTARLSGNVGLSKTTTVGEGTLEVAGDAFLTSRLFFTSQNADYSRQDPYHVVNGRVSYLYDPWKFRVTLYAQNVLNARYSSSRFVVDFGSLDYLAPPFTAGIRLNWDF